MAKVIVGIHGLDNKPEQVQKGQWWEAAIREGLEKNCGLQQAPFTFRMVYWANLLYMYPMHTNPDFAFDALYNDEPYEPVPKDQLKPFTAHWWQVAEDAARETVAKGIDGLKRYVGMDSLANLVLEKLLRDLYFYYNDTNRILDRRHQRRPARVVLIDELKNILRALPPGIEIMLIAHSMGSIIAYDVLRDLGQEEPTFAVAHFVTIGSPLGLPDVKKRVYQERQARPGAPVRTPTVVTTSWANYADQRDPVAVVCHLADYYQANARNITVADYPVLNRVYPK